MPHLTDMDIDRVSLVDKGANGRRFAVLKRRPMVSDPNAPQSTESGGNASDDTEPESGVRAALGTLAKALGLSDEQTFVGFVDNEGAPLTAETVEKAVDSYRDFVLEALKVEKAGRKISGARMRQLKSAMGVLGELINGVEAGYWTPPNSTGIEKGHEVDNMNEQELRDLVAKTVEDTFASAFGEDGAGTQAIAKAIVAAQPKTDAADEPKDEAPVATPAPATETPAPAPVASADVTDITKRLDEIAETNGQVIEAVAKMFDRVEALEGGRRQSTAPEAGDAKPRTITKREKGDMSVLHGILTQ